MALDPSSRYPVQTDSAAGYPLGKARNAGSFQDGSGTPLERDWVNDIWGFQQALLDAAGIEPSGDPDEVGASQYLEAIQSLIAGAPYEPDAPEHWPDPEPTTVSGALDRLAADLHSNRPEIIDDFSGVLVNDEASTPHIISDSGVWLLSSSNSPAIQGLSGDVNNGACGVLSVQATGGSAIECIAMRTCVVRFDSPELIVARVQVMSVASGMAFEFGLTSGVDPTPGDTEEQVVSAILEPSVHANWHIRTGDHSFTRVNSGVAGVASQSVTVALRFDPIEEVFTISVDGSEPVQATGNMPTLSSTGRLFFRVAAPNSGSNRAVRLDLIRFRGRTARAA